MTRRLPDLPDSLRRSLRNGGHGLRILVVRLGAMGDILRTLPAVRLLRAALPEARIHWAVEDHWRILLEGHADVDGLVLAPRRRWDGWLRSPTRWPALLASLGAWRAELRSLRAGLVVDFHGNLRSGLTAWLCGAPVRLGYAGHQQKEGNRWLTTHRVPSGDRRESRVARNLSLVAALGLPTRPLPECALPLVAAGREAARGILADLRIGAAGFAVVAPGASRRQSYKRPPAELLAAACRRLAREGLLPLVVYGPGEESEAREVTGAAGDAAVLAPPTGLRELAALLDAARVFVGGDSGPLHLACAVGCPVVGVFGPTDPSVNRPWGVPFRALAPPGRVYSGIKRSDRAGGGFDGLDGTQLERAIDELLAEPRNPHAVPD